MASETFRITITKNNAGAIAANMESRASAAVRKTLFDMQAHIQNATSRRGTGRVYMRGSRRHQASAPGQPFANDTGTTANAITIRMHSPLHGSLELNGENWRRQEFGTVNMAPRPTVGPALQAVTPAFLSAMRRLTGAGGGSGGPS
jgi:hypothetical protein